ncbi:anthranilate phosphoribosyltransferase [Salisediminibacterium beveridgei]|uniref:Anthranilate phosphoribosyltransferase n=1 Tax=Salisediminibacterium beveridgei TaxID=632773 RepID=A0A1D7QUY1_9BACI|nr:anthranilate phosphoribosyltransferase [Salisediminibacterium beveridgei]AOM82811.1 Anthranilate phosphoribosyltransferase [Salisediminibacterium beveridgei]
MKRTIDQLMEHQTLTEKEAKQFVEEMMTGKHNHETMAAVLAIMQFRGITAEELAGFAKGMQTKAKNISIPGKLLDTCGTGGDSSGSYNVSTASAILLSSMGVNIAKHGNRSISSKTGSADVLEILGIPFHQSEEEAITAISKNHLSFFFAPDYHAAMKYVGPVRAALKIKTIFNLLGPLTNPAGASYRIIGVYGEKEADIMAEAVKRLNLNKVLIVTGHDGLDELTITGPSRVIEVTGDVSKSYTITPEEVGLKRGPIDSAVVTSAQESANLIKSIFNQTASEEATGLLLLNAGAALYTAGEATSIAEGVKLAKQALGDQVLKHLEQIQQSQTGDQMEEQA